MASLFFVLISGVGLFPTTLWAQNIKKTTHQETQKNTVLNNEPSFTKAYIDSLSYYIGVANSAGLKQYMVQVLYLDTQYLKPFVKGVKRAIKANNNLKEQAFFAGINLGKSLLHNLNTGQEVQVLGTSDQHINTLKMLEGFMDAVNHKIKIKKNNKPITLSEAQARIEQHIAKLNNLSEALQTEKKRMEEIKVLPNVQSLGNGVYYQIEKIGTGPIPNLNAKVTIHYEGYYANTKEEGEVEKSFKNLFDSSYQKGKPSIFTPQNLIPGFRDALLKMPQGSIWKIYVPSSLAYGSAGVGSIPPYSSLCFKVELLAVDNTK